MDHDAKTCFWCGQPYVCELFEVWRDPDTGAARDFQLETCCEGSREDACDFLATGERREVRDWLKGLGLPTPLRQVYSDAGHLRLDAGLTVRPVPFKVARDFVARHHRHNRPPAGWRFGFGAFNDAELVAVAMVGRPVARALDDGATVEVNRLCVDPTLPAALTWNACSLLYGACAREAHARGFARIVTYTLEREAGTTLRAAGWTPEARTRGGTWDRPGRSRTDTHDTGRKVRWSRTLRHTPPRSGAQLTLLAG